MALRKNKIYQKKNYIPPFTKLMLNISKLVLNISKIMLNTNFLFSHIIFIDTFNKNSVNLAKNCNFAFQKQNMFV